MHKRDFRGRGNRPPGPENQGEYLTNIAAVTPAGRAAEAGEIGTQRIQAVVRRVAVRLTGSLQADEKSDVGSNAMGNVSATLVDRGSVVKKGDVLIEIDPRDAQYALDEGSRRRSSCASASGWTSRRSSASRPCPRSNRRSSPCRLAERNYRRAEALKKQNAIATSDADQMETDYRSAVHRYHLAVFVAKQLYQSYRQATTHLVALRKAVEDCTIRAPFDGLVASRDISVGERVIALFPGAKLATVLRIDPLRLSLTVPQQEMSKIKIGQTVTFQTDAFPGETFVARSATSRRSSTATTVRWWSRRWRRTTTAGSFRGCSSPRSCNSTSGGPSCTCPRRRSAAATRSPRSSSFAAEFSASRSSPWEKRREGGCGSPPGFRPTTSSPPRRSGSTTATARGRPIARCKMRIAK